MRRKLVKHGEATLMISLPAKWLKNNNLGKGDELEVEERGKILEMRANSNNKDNSIEIEINDKNLHDLRVLLTHSYRKGFDKIILKGKVSDIVGEVNRICSAVLLGFEVVTRSKDKIVLENISQPDYTKYASMLSKVFLLISEMPNAIKDGKINFEEIKDTRDQCDKFVLFCRRILRENKEVDTTLEWEFLTLLTHVQHTYYYMFEYAFKNKIKLSPEVYKLVTDSKIYFELLQKSYIEKNISYISHINSLKNKYQFGKCFDMLEKTKGKETVIVSYLREVFRFIQISTSPILSQILEKKES